jgi:hypothetical protein
MVHAQNRPCTEQWNVYTAKTKYRNFETNIPRKGISGSQSQFPHSCVCERFIYSHDRSPYIFCWRKYVDWSWDFINRSQTHESWNWGWGRAIPRKGINKGDFRCSVPENWRAGEDEWGPGCTSRPEKEELWRWSDLTRSTSCLAAVAVGPPTAHNNNRS